MHLSKLLFMAGLAISAPTQNPIKFLPFGDSITEITCWRALTWDMLAAEGLADKVDFVGSKTNNPGGCKSSKGNFDTGHEGHSGWEAVTIADQYIEGWVADTKPDIVNFMLGTNDISKGKTLEQIIKAYDTIIAAVRAANPNVKVIIDKLIPLPPQSAEVKALNDAIPAWVKKHSTKKSPIVIADCSTENGYTEDMLSDGVHPNAAGDKQIAGQIGPLLVEYVKKSI